jgi:hypothetical protein
MHKIVYTEVMLGGDGRLLVESSEGDKLLSSTTKNIMNAGEKAESLASKFAEDNLETVEKEGQGVITFSLLGGCFFFLLKIWNFFILNSLSRHGYYLKMIKHMFYIKIDQKSREKLAFLKQPRKPNQYGWIEAHDSFAT